MGCMSVKRKNVGLQDTRIVNNFNYDIYEIRVDGHDYYIVQGFQGINMIHNISCKNH